MVLPGAPQHAPGTNTKASPDGATPEVLGPDHPGAAQQPPLPSPPRERWAASLPAGSSSADAPEQRHAVRGSHRRTDRCHRQQQQLHAGGGLAMGMNLNREDKRAKTVTICLNPAAYEELLGKATQAGMQPAVIARRLLLEHIRFFAS